MAQVNRKVTLEMTILRKKVSWGNEKTVGQPDGDIAVAG